MSNQWRSADYRFAVQTDEVSRETREAIAEAEAANKAYRLGLIQLHARATKARRERSQGHPRSGAAAAGAVVRPENSKLSTGIHVYGKSGSSPNKREDTGKCRKKYPHELKQEREEQLRKAIAEFRQRGQWEDDSRTRGA